MNFQTSGANLLRRLGIPFAAALVAATIATAVAPSRAGSHAPAPVALKDSELKPLVDVHELMEHVVEGAFETAKKGMQDKPADAKVWRAVRDASLLLGECGNLLLIRKPADADDADWTRLCVAMRQTGDSLAKAAKAKDFDNSRAAYLKLVQSCNQCHIKFGDDGEPKIDP